MSLWILLFIMFLSGLAGGIVNYLLPSNENTDRSKIRNSFHCVVLGLGATLLVPLFLEIAQSKLMDNIHTQFSWRSKWCQCDMQVDTLAQHSIDGQSTSVPNTNSSDTLNRSERKEGPDSSHTLKSAALVPAFCGDCSSPLKHYFLYAAYCFLAASAGFRFISSVTDSVLKDKQLANLKEEKAEAVKQLDLAETEKVKAETEAKKVEEEMVRIEKEKEKLDAHNKIRQQQEEVIAIAETGGIEAAANRIGPITNANDPQKGRFGGLSTNNNRALKATVTKSRIPEFYNVTIWVESLDPVNAPLNTDVIFYIHDSFSPSVYTIKTAEFIDGKAMDDDILSYGAFTVGAITDNGNTMLELDLAEQPEFPQKFRER